MDFISYYQKSAMAEKNSLKHRKMICCKNTTLQNKMLHK